MLSQLCFLIAAFCDDLLRVLLVSALWSHSRPSSVEALVYRGCPVRTHQCDPEVSRVRRDQSANSCLRGCLCASAGVVVLTCRPDFLCFIHTPLRPGRLGTQSIGDTVHHTWRHSHIRLPAVPSLLKELATFP